MQNPEPRSQYLNFVLRQIDQTKLRIPQFQRHFVWGASDVLDLLDSIKLGYPIGSVLTWRLESADEYFSGFRHGPFPVADPTLASFEVILDGAQRMSTLYGALKQPGEEPLYRVYYDLRHESFHHIASKGRPGRLIESEVWQLPMSSLLDSRRFLEAQSAMSELHDSAELAERALSLYSTFQEYQIPIISLSDASLEEVVEVFRRVNSSGTPLSAVDFTRALTWRSNFDLEPTFDRLMSKFSGSALDELSEEFLVRCLAVTAGLGVDAREIVELKDYSGRTSGLNAEVEAMTQALERSERFLRVLQVRKISEIPYEIQRILLFAIFLHSTDVSARRLVNWFWASTFAEEFQSKPDSYTTRMINSVREGDLGQTLVVNNPLSVDLFATRKRRAGSAATRGFDLLIFNREPLSIFSAEMLDRDGTVFRRLFETTDLQGEGPSNLDPSALSNWVLIERSEVHRWSAMRPEVVDALLTGEALPPAATNSLVSQGFALEPTRDGSLNAWDIIRARSNTLLRPIVAYLGAEGKELQ